MLKRSLARIMAAAAIIALVITSPVSADGDLNKEQRIWTLSNISNINAGLIDTEANLSKHAKDIGTIIGNPTFKNHMGTWDVVWGPVIVNKETKGSYRTANTMYVAKGVDPSNEAPLYVIAIAGTNIVSHYGWFVEDFDVNNTVAWPPSELSQDVSAQLDSAFIAQGTSIGLSILWQMEDQGKTILDFLKNENFAANTEIAVAGHSLGGALAPTMAMALHGTQGTWAEGSNATLSTYPTAGPSPGDNNFANLVASTLGGNFHSTVNTLDVVPHAWQKSTAEKIASLYTNLDITTCQCSAGASTGIPKNPVIDGVGSWIVNHPGMSYQRIPVDHTFNGPDNNKQSCSPLVAEATKIKNATLRGNYKLYLMRLELQGILRKMTGNKHQKITCDQIAGFFQFLGELGYQHTTVYMDHFQIPTDLKTLIHRYIDLSTVSPAAASKIIFDFVYMVNQSL